MQLKVNGLKCCGMKDITAMNESAFTPRKFVEQLCKKVGSYQQPNRGAMKYAGFAHYTLSAAWITGRKTGPMSETVQKRCVMLTIYIERNGLGTIMWTDPAPSPTYQGKHMLKAGIFTPDNEALVAFGRKHEWIPKTWKDTFKLGTWG